jgi:hypothetical protein
VSDFGERFRLTLLTNNVAFAQRAEAWGVDRIGLDLERVGKLERQQGEGLRLSDHRPEDLPGIVQVLRRARPFVRVNPIHQGTADEIETVIGAGARVLMLPYFRTAAEVETFVRRVDGRARATILIETSSALVRLREILAVPGIDEVMVGLNDLRIELRVRNFFEVLSSPLLDGVAAQVREKDLDFSVGGVARPDDASLPVPPDLVLAQYPRLGATGAWLSRSFFRGLKDPEEAGTAIRSLRQRLTEWARASAEAQEAARGTLARRAQELGAISSPGAWERTNLKPGAGQPAWQ